MSPKKGIKRNTSNKGNLENWSWAEMPQLFQNQRLQGKQSYSSSQWNPLLHKYWDFQIRESRENIFEHVWQKSFVQWESTTPLGNRASVESFIHLLFTLFSNNMAIGKSLYTEIIDKQVKKREKQRTTVYRVSGEMSNYTKILRILLSILNTMNDKLKTRTGDRGREDSLNVRFYMDLDCFPKIQTDL